MLSVRPAHGFADSATEDYVQQLHATAEANAERAAIKMESGIPEDEAWRQIEDEYWERQEKRCSKTLHKNNASHHDSWRT